MREAQANADRKHQLKPKLKAVNVRILLAAPPNVLKIPKLSSLYYKMVCLIFLDVKSAHCKPRMQPQRHVVISVVLLKIDPRQHLKKPTLVPTVVPPVLLITLLFRAPLNFRVLEA